MTKYIFRKMRCSQNNIFDQSNSREITRVYKSNKKGDIKIARNIKNQHKKLFYFLKKNKRIYFNNIGGDNNTGSGGREEVVK